MTIIHDKIRSNGIRQEPKSVLRPKVLVVGPLPPPINGMTIATKHAVSWLSEHFDVCVVNLAAGLESSFSSTLRGPDRSGSPTLRKVISRVRLLFSIWYSLHKLRPNLCYITLSQSKLGFLKDGLVIALASMYKVPVVGHVHGGHFGELYREAGRFFRFFIRASAQKLVGAIVLTERLKGMFAGLVRPDRVYVVENFVADEVLPSEEDFAHRRECLKGKWGGARLLYLSNLIPSKGYLDVIRAIYVLRSCGMSVSCDLAGAWMSEHDRVVAEELVRELSLQDSVRFHGIVTGEAKRTLLRNADVFVLPTYYRFEGVPLALLEAMAWGLPVIVTNHGGIGDVVRDRVNGVFVQPRAPENIADAVCWLLEDAERYHCISTANIQLVAERFTENRSAQSLVRVISRLLQG